MAKVKKETIDEILKNNGFNQEDDYIISLQGPTVILSEKGEAKMNDDKRKQLQLSGINFL